MAWIRIEQSVEASPLYSVAGEYFAIVWQPERIRWIPPAREDKILHEQRIDPLDRLCFADV